jgi:hypothetical protein
MLIKSLIFYISNQVQKPVAQLFALAIEQVEGKIVGASTVQLSVVT